MKRFLCTLLSAAFVFCFGITAFAAETEDYEFATTSALESSGKWGQSLVVPSTVFSADLFTDTTQLYVEFETFGEKQEYTTSCAELVLQNYSTADPPIWAKVAPVDYTDTSATFDYADMVKAYGSADLSTVDNIIIGDCGVALKVTKMTASNVKVIEITTAETTVTEAETESAVSAEETSSAVTNATADTNPDSSTFPLIPIIIVAAVVVVIIIVVVVVIVIRNKNSLKFK